MRFKKLPSDDVYVRLQPSKLHGVGVFAIRKIPEGTYMFPWEDKIMDESGDRWIPKKIVDKLPPLIQKLYFDFAPLIGKRYLCPQNFGLMTAAWYLNNSKTPNVGCDKDYHFYALKDIDVGEELVTDYDSYSDQGI